jgi:ribonuclease BN (tRNA processing enzyme)
VKLTVIGCSPAWPNPGSAHSGYLVEGPGLPDGAGSLLLDCGPGVLARLRERGGWPQLDAIAITHFHLDHWGDLVPWVWGSLYWSGGRPPRPELWVPTGGRAILEEFGGRLGFPDMFDRVFVVSEYEAGIPFETAGFTITGLRVPHYTLEAHGFRVTDGSRTLAYSGDSAPADELAEVARDADLFLCEATLADGASDGPDLRGHLALDEAEAAFADSGAKRLIVIHRPVELASEGVELAQDGLVVEF